MVKDVDKENNKVSFTYKELLGTWEDNIKDFKQGTVVHGIVRDPEKSHNGIFIELTPNLVGLAEYKENMEYGQDVNVYIKKIISEKKKKLIDNAASISYNHKYYIPINPETGEVT